MNIQLTVERTISRNCYISTFFIEDKNLLENIKQKIIDKANNSPLSYKTNVKAKFTGFESLSLEPEIREFAMQMKPFSNRVCNKKTEMRECWGNVYHKDDYAVLHHHRACTGFSGILYLTNEGPGTYFKDFDLTIKEEYGKVVLFEPMLLHEVKPSNLQTTRITMAFNCYEISPWA